jgi:hypothetical protein
MEPEGSLPHSQQPATCPYPEPDEYSPCHLTSRRSILILSSHIRLGLLSGLFPSGFPTKPPVRTSLLHHTCYMPCLVHFSWFDLPNNIWWAVQSIKLSAIQYVPRTPLFYFTLCLIQTGEYRDGSPVRISSGSSYEAHNSACPVASELTTSEKHLL